MKKVTEEKVTNIEEAQVVENKDVKEAVALKLTEDDANYYLQVLSLFLVDDDRLKPLQQHFIDMIKRNNEEDKK